MKLNKTSILKFLFLLFTVLILSDLVSSASIKKVQDKADLSAEAERHRTKLKKTKTAQFLGSTTESMVPFNGTNHTVSQIFWNNLNTTQPGPLAQKSEHFKLRARSWNDNKLYDRQLDIIYKEFLHQNDKEINLQTTKDIISIFTSDYYWCDVDGDQVLNITEFTGCFANDTYLSIIVPPRLEFANYVNNSFTNSTGFFPILFNTLDANTANYLTFYDYMQLRLFVYSWKKCSVVAPFIEELLFECAIDIAAGYKTQSRTGARRVYQLGLEISNTNSQRNIDFITFTMIASSMRLYGLINGRGDEDASRNEFNAAMDANLLPPRYNQDIINQVFRLIEQNDIPNQGIDMISFLFYDNCLKLFYVPFPNRRWYQTVTEFTTVLGNYMFPYQAHLEFQRIPQSNITAATYQMYTYMNITKWKTEDNQFLKFSQKKEKALAKNSQVPSSGIFNITSWLLPANMNFNNNKTAQFIFNVLDNDLDGFITFYDFGSWMQVSYLFAKFDNFNKGSLLAGDVYEKMTTYSEFPTISYHMRDRARRFNLLSQDIYVDLLRCLTFFRIDDMMDANVRRSDKTLLYEVELKHVFHVINLDFVPDGYLDQCLRSPDELGVPKYDWECAFLRAMTATVQALENLLFYNQFQSNNLTLSNTQFTNVDPAVLPAPLVV